MKIWPQDTIRELLAQAALTGEARAELTSPVDAARFRDAIYNFRRSRNLGRDLAITLEANTVVVTKRDAPSVTILDPEAAAPL